ncbi:MAG: hypothetical protein HY879_21665 [Deltaproteobacteria bacterium]|nr:hypothetical protein [Deltaproteobacteria bacterium]
MTANAILVTGDFIIDQHVYEGRRFHYAQRPRVGVKVKPEIGGAALVQGILKELLQGNKQGWTSRLTVQDAMPNDAAFGLNNAEHAYAYWRPFPKGISPDRQFWRVSEAMGFGFNDGEKSCVQWPIAADLPESPEIMVISEGGMGFRDCPENWQKERLTTARWIVLKTTSPVGVEELWDHLTINHRNKLIVIMSAHELRKSPARLHAGLSWEETIEGVLRELRPEGVLPNLVKCRHLIITFESEGALWIDLTDGTELSKAYIHLIHNAGSIEGEHSYKTEGKGFGFLSCLAAAVAWRLSDNLEIPDIASALEGGLAAMRDLREKGHGPAGEEPQGFPSKRLAGVIKHPGTLYSRAVYSSSPPADSTWSILRQSQLKPVFDLARLVLLRGPIALESLPHLSIGKLFTADRTEMEAYRSLLEVIRRYEDKKESGKKPLSIGVFGPPGAGKSFAVKEIAASTVTLDGWLEFNLSQFNSPDDLIGAFHQIRDRVLQGQLPVAFFDEFDSQKFRWLQYLLAPMQDGKFQEGQLTHTLGKCIFVFAGGTSWTFETFGPPDPSKISGVDVQAYNDFRLAKGSDFKSRIDAYLDVIGPNQRKIHLKPGSSVEEQIEKVGGHDFITDPTDTFFPIRRALMGRSELKCGKDDKLEIDEGLAHALLHVKEYMHGSRSLGKALQPFAAARPGTLHRSLLMPLNQLEMHTNAEEFIFLCSNAPKIFSPEARLTMEQIKQIAPAISETFRALGKKEGWSKPETDKDFGNLSPFFQESNRAAAKRMLNLLALIGLTLVEGTASAAEEDKVKQHLEYYLLALAEAEHEGWMIWHLEKGWCYNPKRDDEKKQHDCLIPFSKLSDKDKGKDRDTIRHYPDFAREAGMKIVFIEK